MSACVQKAVVFAAVLAPVDGLGVTAGVQLWVANVRVQLVDDRRAHVRQVQLADIPVHGVVGLYAERAQYLGRCQTLQSHMDTLPYTSDTQFIPCRRRTAGHTSTPFFSAVSEMT